MSTQIKEIVIENAPEISGLTFRGFRGKADYPVMTEIINAANQADGQDEIVKVEDIAINYEHIQRSDPQKDMVFIEIKGQPVGYGRCMWDMEEDHTYRYSMFVHLAPQGRGKGLGRPVMEYFLQRLTEIAEQHTDAKAKHFQTWSADNRQWWNDMLEDLGFKKVRYGFGMRRPCDLPVEVTPLPEGIEVRPVEESHMRQIFDAEAEAFRDHWGYVAPTEKDYQRWLEEPLHNPSLWKVAWDGDEVVGMVLNFINRDENETFERQRGYTEDISVRRPWRRQGVAQALLTRSIQMFIEMGMDETYLGVDAENPNGALQLYTKVGYQQDRLWLTYRKEFDHA